ncbi:uncharacterized protein LOC143919133 [Arctopsyche grandis]|uniref:uncharacterized protein LOC143919133 n=1 Tax=Arctopsyche grandis TaxID=121162 RepID=UPI00406D8057
MECRLCLGSAPAETSVSIFGDPHPQRLEQRIRTCCQIQVIRGDGLPDMVCLSCKTNLELLISFREACFRSYETSQLRLDDCLKIKTEEVLLEDVICDDEPSLPIIHQENNEICSKPFPSESKLVLHTKEKPFKCVICLKSYSQRSNLSYHKKSHTGIRSHKCDICLKSFIRKNHLASHIRSHTGEKPYKCEICLKPFSEKSSLRIHKKSHTGPHVKPHKCEICLKYFSQKSSLVIHVKLHTGKKPYKCDICLKAFAQKSSLLLHNKVHTGIKPHKCDICLKSFIHKNVLVIHLRTHTGEKPYECEICLKSFAQKSKLKLHKTKAHSDKTTQM